MILLDRPIGPINGLQIYRDHADPAQFYYVPERPRIARNDGNPEFVFLKYARDITDNPNYSPEKKDQIGGGLLAFTTDLSIDQEVIDDTRRQLARFARAQGASSTTSAAIALAPIPFEGGTVRLSMISDKPPEGEEAAARARGVSIFEYAWGATKPSLYGNNRATFGVVLDHEAAQLMEAALEAGVGYIGVVYDLEFLGMRPAFDVRVTAEYSRIYDHFEGELGVGVNVGYVGVSADLAAGYQRLIDDGSIKIEVTTYTDNADMVSQANAAKDWALQQITSDLFQSSLKPPSFMTRSGNSVMDMLKSAASGLFGGQTARQGISSAQPRNTTAHRNAAVENNTPTPDNTNNTANNNTNNTDNATDNTANNNDNATDDTANNNDNGNPEPTPDDATGSENPDANASPTPDQQGASNTGGGSGSGSGSDPSQGNAIVNVGLKLRYYRQEELKTRVFEFSRQAAEKRRMAPQGLLSAMVAGTDLSSRIIEVNLDSDFFKRLKLDVSPATDWQHEGVELTTVSVSYPGSVDPEGDDDPEQVDGDTFSESDTETFVFDTWLNEDKDMSYRYRTEVHFKANSPWRGREQVFRSDWIRSRARPLVINALDHVGLMTITIAADNSIDFSTVSQAVVDVEYQDPTSDWAPSEKFILDAEHKTHTWKLRLSDRHHRSYRYQVAYTLPGNVQYTTPWIDGDEPNLVIGSPFRGKKRMRIIPMLSADEFIEAVVDVVYTEPAHGYRSQVQHVFTPDQKRSVEVVFDTIDEEPGEVEVRAVVVRSDFNEPPLELGPLNPPSSVIPISARTTEARPVQVRLAADAALMGQFYAVEVQLREADGAVEVATFTSPEDLSQTLWVATEEGQPPAFSWRWRGVRRDGQSAGTETWTDGAGDELLVSLT